MLTEIRELYDYTSWADQRLLDLAAGLSEEELRRDLGGSFPTVLGTLAHVLTADWVWLERWNGVSPSGPPADWELATLAEVRTRWRALRAQRDAFLDRLDEEGLVRRVSYANTRGEGHIAPLWQLLLHAVNHATYHRGQVVTYLRQLGRDALPTDLVVWQRLVAAGELERGEPKP
jgi:uncharacterized damage-inducible protein DinB